MKCLVKPTSAIMLLLERQEVVQPNRPSVVTNTAFVVSRVAAGQIVLVAPDLPDTATDEDFLAHWKACRKDGKVDEELAVQSYLTMFKEPEPEPTPAPTPKPTPKPTPAPVKK